MIHRKLKQPGPHGGYARFGKRLLDVFGSSVGIVALSPLFAAIGIVVNSTSRGPILFVQSRPGIHGRAFGILKFHSMLVFEDSYDISGNELSNDQRITKIGRFLRRSSLDELPQLFNVWQGDMSLVGPRPALQYQVERYDAHQRVRLNVKPGITGLAQVSGRNSLTWEEKTALDLRYVDSLRLRLDLQVLWKTFGVVVSGEGLAFGNHDRLSEHDGELRRRVGECKGDE